MTAAAVNMTSCQGGSPLSQTRLLPPLRADGVQQGGRRAGRRCCHLIACPAATTPGPWRLAPPLPTPAGRLPDEVTRQRRWAGARCGPPRLPRAALGLPGPVRSALHSARRVARAHLLAGAPPGLGRAVHGAPHPSGGRQPHARRRSSPVAARLGGTTAMPPRPARLKVHPPPLPRAGGARVAGQRAWGAGAAGAPTTGRRLACAPSPHRRPRSVVARMIAGFCSRK